MSVKKRIVSLLLVLCLSMTMFAGTAFAVGTEEPERGVLQYSVAIDPQYEDAQAFSEGLAAVQKGGKWGYIDTDGEVVIPFEYDIAFIFNEGLAVVGFLTDTYEQEEYDWDEEYGYYPTGAYTEYGRYEMGFIDQDNNLTMFHDPYAYDYENDEPIDDGVLIMSFERDQEVDGYRHFFHNGYICLALHEEPGYYLYDMTGEPASIAGHEISGYYGWQVTEGWVITGIPAAEGGEQRYLNVETGKYLDIPFETDTFAYVSLQPFNQGIAPVWFVEYDDDYMYTTWKLGFVDTNGKWIIQPQYELYWRSGVYGLHKVFGETGVAMVQNASGMMGGIDKTGKTVIPFQYEELQPYGFGLAAAKKGGLYGYLDSKGNWAIQPQFEQVTGFGSDGYAVAFSGNTAYLIDAKGNEIPGADNLDPASYITHNSDGSVTLYAPAEYVVMEEKGKYGYGKVEYKPALPAVGETSSWAYNEVCAAIEEDLVPNHLQNLYLNNINRSEFSALIVQAISEVLDQDIEEIVEEQTGKSLDAWKQSYPFTDTTDGDIIAAYALGVVSGRGAGKFDPYATITRQEASSLLMRAAKVLGMEVDSVSNAGFVDAGQIGVWFKDSVNFVYQINVMGSTGNNKFSPLGSYTREQSYMTIYRLFQAIINN